MFVSDKKSTSHKVGEHKSTELFIHNTSQCRC